MSKKTAYVIWSGVTAPDFATKTSYPGAMEFNTWAHGFLEGSKNMKEEFGGVTILNVVSADEIEGMSDAYNSEREAVKRSLSES